LYDREHVYVAQLLMLNNVRRIAATHFRSDWSNRVLSVCRDAHATRFDVACAPINGSIRGQKWRKAAGIRIDLSLAVIIVVSPLVLSCGNGRICHRAFRENSEYGCDDESPWQRF
jgi:hypothetical protein